MGIKVLMPALSPTMKRGKIAKWNIEAGNKVGIGDVIAEIETDKATMEFETLDEGIIGSILVKEGDEVEVGQPILWILEDENDQIPDDEPQIDNNADQKLEIVCEKQDEMTVVKHDSAQHQQTLGRNATSTPAARARARELGVSIEEIIKSGVTRKIKDRDVVEYATALTDKQTAHSQLATEVAQMRDMSQMQKVIMQRMVEAKTTVPHFYMEIIVCVDKLLEIQELFRSKNMRLTLTHCFVSCIAKGFKEVPAMNVRWNNGQIQQNQDIDVALAVSLEGDGLITPIIKDADRLSLKAIIDRSTELIDRAKENKLMPHEYQGGSVTLSNLGMYGIDSFYPIMNLPQASIIGVGTARDEVCVHDGEVKVRKVCSITISVDHRVINGAAAASFMQYLRYIIENPYMLLV